MRISVKKFVRQRDLVVDQEHDTPGLVAQREESKMEVPPALVAPAAALAGSLLGALGAIGGGLLAQLANRRQWIRETRRSAYVGLIGAGRRVQDLLDDVASGPSRLPEQDPRDDFSQYLDAAILVAGHRLQAVLYEWTRLLAEVNHVEELDSAERGWLAQRWQTERDHCVESVKEELGVAGGGRRSRRTAYSAAVSGGFIALAANFMFVADSDNLGWLFVLFAAVYLVGAIVAAQRWRVDRGRFLENRLDLLQVFLLLSVLCVLGAISEGGTPHQGLLTFAAFAAWAGAAVQRWFDDLTIVDVVGLVRSRWLRRTGS